MSKPSNSTGRGLPIPYKERSNRLPISAIDVSFSIVRLVALIGSAVWIIYHPLPQRDHFYLSFLLAGYFVYTVILYSLVFRFPGKARRIHIIELILDMALLSFVVPMTGGLNSTFAFGFYLLAAGHSLYYGLLGSLSVGIFSSLVYVFSCSPFLLVTHWTDVSLRATFLVVTAVMIGFLSDREKRMRNKLIRTEQLAAMGMMSSRVAHAIRNPLSSIILNAELVFDELKKFQGIDTAQAKVFINSIISEVNRLNAVAEECLLFIRQAKVDKKECDINGILRSLAGFLEREICRRNIKFFEYFEEGLPFVLIDEGRFRQAVINILKNSFDAMPEGGELRLLTKRLNGNIEITIEDTGKGISKEHLRRIFDPFFSTKDMGIGLGLSIARDIIVEHGGRIYCDSKENKGTTVRIFLPLSSR